MPARTSSEDGFAMDGNHPGLDGLPLTRLSNKAEHFSKSPQVKANIIDIRQHVIDMDLSNDIMSMLMQEQGPKKMPTMLLYDAAGLQIFEEITYLDEYYLTNAEIDVLINHANEIAQNIQSESMIIELGSGNLRKVSILLKALDEAGKSIDYYALDLSEKELERTLSDVPKFKNIVCRGLLGTYDDGLEWIRSGVNASRPKCILSLGSSIGNTLDLINAPNGSRNFHRHEASAFLKDYAGLLRASDSMIIGLDATNDGEKVYHAYNDSQGVTHRFVLNGLANANRILKEPVFELDDWRVIGEYVFDKDGGRHQAFYAPLKDLSILGVRIQKDERVQVEQSLKYSPAEANTLWEQAGLKEVGRWTASRDEYSVHMLTRGDKLFALQPSQYAATAVPTLEDFRGIWATWDTVTRGMIPNNELLNKPIKLRNACIFYLGHIPTFLDIQLSKATGDQLLKPHYPKIFERGIDPDVDNPDHCHAHSEIPDEWPPLAEIIQYQADIRRRVEGVYAANRHSSSRKIGSSLWISFEHEIMHLETLLYMLLQSDNAMDPPRTVKPNLAQDAADAETRAVPNEWFSIPQQTIDVGLDDTEDNSCLDHHFGWDNEKPRRKTEVKPFLAKGRPITNEEYAKYLRAMNNSNLPASWSQRASSKSVSNGHTNGNGHGHAHQGGDCNGVDSPATSYLDTTMVRTVYGPVPLKQALHWPVFASYNELAGCAAWMGGRIPTADEARSIYTYSNILKMKEAEKTATVPAVNGHLVNNGVEETPPSPTAVNGGSSDELFANLEGANVGFKHWHPVAVTGDGNKLAGQGEMGGVWEWTSSVLEKHEGFEPMELYPAYTADFFDGKHNVVLGGSWATHPRIAGRKTFINWYQRNYPYAWIGARLVKDL